MLVMSGYLYSWQYFLAPHNLMQDAWNQTFTGDKLLLLAILMDALLHDVIHNVPVLQAWLYFYIMKWSEVHN